MREPVDGAEARGGGPCGSLAEPLADQGWHVGQLARGLQRRPHDGDGLQYRSCACHLDHGVGTNTLRRRHGRGAACIGTYVGVPASAGGATVQPILPREAPAGRRPNLRRASERGDRDRHDREEPQLKSSITMRRWHSQTRRWCWWLRRLRTRTPPTSRHMRRHRTFGPHVAGGRRRAGHAHHRPHVHQHR